MQSRLFLSTPAVFAVPHAATLTECEYKRLFDEASPQRKIRAGKFLRREDACRSIVGEALIRYSVRTAAGIRLDELCLTNNHHGKPSIPGVDVHFNIAHSGEWVVCGVDEDEIGVDVERSHNVDFGIANRFFSRPEIELLDAIAVEEDRRATFFKIWSLKESYIKAIGKGLSCPLDSFACLPPAGSGRVEFRRFDESLPLKSFGLIDIDPAYSCAVCLGGPERAVTPVMVTVERLIDAP